jgi:hypothetical protein
MSTADGGTSCCTEEGSNDLTGRRHRLALQLADMIHGAVTVRVSLTDPTTMWPTAHARVRDEAGAPIELSRTTAVVAARWVMRTWPEVDWSTPHTFDLATATLICSGLVAAGRGR